MLKIYKIIDNTNGNIYIGKTENTLKQRLAVHKIDKNCSSTEIIKNGDYRMELIEETQDKTRERYWIENTQCINKQIPGRTDKEYYEDNKESILKQRKEYSKNNKDKIKKYQSEYRENNKDKTKEYKKYINSMGGDPRYNNNLLKIDLNLFNLN
tara:strand:+ start:542 stop:1003 length:462 start_codon:yes stop_codon:yes gene_type:complete